jgi:protein-S-isoprenylcysteine O-methyltransferase Ste14
MADQDDRWQRVGATAEELAVSGADLQFGHGATMLQRANERKPGPPAVVGLLCFGARIDDDRGDAGARRSPCRRGVETMPMAHLRAILALPCNVLVVIPALLCHFGGQWRLASFDSLYFWLALPCFAGGVALMIATIRRFATEGRGTLAPWNPTQRLVVGGPYRYVRNPMISGVLCNLLGESLLLQSWPIAAWALAFFAGNTLYFVLAEEPGLERRFGDDYRRDRAAVPRWIPRRTPYEG